MQYTFEEIERHAYIDGWNTKDCPLFQMAESGAALEDIRENVKGYEPEAGFPAEDCLQDVISSLSDVLDEMRANNKHRNALQGIMDMLVGKQQELANNAEYGSEQLNKLIGEII